MSQDKTIPEVLLSVQQGVDDGGVYLVVADESQEFQSALKKAAIMAVRNKRHVAVLFMIDDDAFLHWRMIEKQIKKDKRSEAEKHVWEVSKRLYDMSGQRPAVYIKEGKTRDAILEVLNADPNIRMLVLGAGTASSNPLVSYFTRKGLPLLKVPLLVVPDTL